MATVSVIIPNYNHVAFLRERIDSVLQQTYQDFDVVILDDASTDGSRQFLETFAHHPRMTLCFNDQNSGSTFRQWNKGIALARGKYVWIAESDDAADHRFLERLVPILEGDSRVVLVKCRSQKVDEEGRCLPGAVEDPATRDWSSSFVIEGREDCRLQLEHGNSISNASAVLFRRRTYMDVGGADESFRMCGDWLLWAKMMMRGDFAYQAEPLNRYRFHAGSVRSQCSTNGIREVEDLKVYRHLLQGLTVSRAETRCICDKIVKRWIRRARLSSRRGVSATHRQEAVRLLKDIDRWYAWHVCKQAVLKVLNGGVRRCLSAR